MFLVNVGSTGIAVGGIKWPAGIIGIPIGRCTTIVMCGVSGRDTRVAIMRCIGCLFARKGEPRHWLIHRAGGGRVSR